MTWQKYLATAHVERASCRLQDEAQAAGSFSRDAFRVVAECLVFGKIQKYSSAEVDL